jgi:hypothetical protein
MPTQTTNLPLFMEDIYDALRCAVQSLGGPKAVGAQLWPHKPVDQAHRELGDCLNRDNPRKLDPEETLAILRLAREAGYHQAKHWLDAELGYAPSDPVEPETELTKLIRAYLERREQNDKVGPKIDEMISKISPKVASIRR